MPHLDLIHPVNVENVPDLVHKVRHLRFFTKHVAHGVRSIGDNDALNAHFDQNKSARVFVDWVQHVNQQKNCASVNRRDYIAFSAGTLLTQMLTQKAIETKPQLGLNAASNTPLDAITSFWPEGFIGLSYCLTVLEAIYHQEGLEPFKLHPSAYDLRAWWSFKENFGENPWIAIAFLDYFIGQRPNWENPSLAAYRPAIQKLSGPEHLSGRSA